jgi:hypothetical protein
VHKGADALASGDGVQTAQSISNDDRDLKRAATLISLHQSVKLHYQDTGLDEELGQARGQVQKVLGSLSQSA